MNSAVTFHSKIISYHRLLIPSHFVFSALYTLNYHISPDIIRLDFTVVQGVPEILLESKLFDQSENYIMYSN